MRTYWFIVFGLALLTGLSAFWDLRLLWAPVIVLLTGALAARMTDRIQAFRRGNPSRLASVLGIGCGLVLVGAVSAHVALWASGACIVLLPVWASLVRDLQDIDGTRS